MIGNLIGIWAELTELMVLAGRGPADLHRRINGPVDAGARNQAVFKT